MVADAVIIHETVTELAKLVRELEHDTGIFGAMNAPRLGLFTSQPGNNSFFFIPFVVVFDVAEAFLCDLFSSQNLVGCYLGGLQHEVVVAFVEIINNVVANPTGRRLQVIDEGLDIGRSG